MTEVVIPVAGALAGGLSVVAIQRFVHRWRRARGSLPQHAVALEARDALLSEALARLDQVNKDLARANEAKSSFLASMSHELRTPLSGILLAGELLSDPLFGPVPQEKVRELGARIIMSGKHLLGLINDLLDLSRIEMGRLELHRETLDVGEVIVEAGDAVRPLAKQKGIHFEVPAVEGLTARADALRIRQVLINLLTNAVKFTPEGGNVSVRAHGSGPLVSIEVTDSGIGVLPEDQERIFEAFEQASGSASEGVGLGLAISRRIASLHGGTLAVSSAPGTGSTFTLTLPVEGED